jgi:uncharacterized membrane-anchored protein
MMLRTLLFSLAVLAQVAILLVSPVEKLVVRQTGRVITIETKPVDPYDIFRGYYMVLSYVASEPPGFRDEAFTKNEKVYTLLKKDQDGIWQPLSVSRNCPENLPDNQAVIRGRIVSRWLGPIRYGIEEFYMPEAVRHQMETEAQNARRQTGAPSRLLADVAVDEQGRSSLLRLHIGDKTYAY